MARLRTTRRKPPSFENGINGRAWMGAPSVTELQPEWLPLSEAVDELRKRLVARFGPDAAAYCRWPIIELGLIGGFVPIRGVPAGVRGWRLIPALQLADSRTRITMPADHLSIYENRRAGAGSFQVVSKYWSVELDMSTLESYARNNMLPRSMRESSSGPKAEKLGSASEAQVRSAVRQVYESTRAAGSKPPNIKQLPSYVRPILHKQGVTASGVRIQAVGDQDEFKAFRLPSGPRWKH